jgi:hypothetical protein
MVGCEGSYEAEQRKVSEPCSFLSWPALFVGIQSSLSPAPFGDPEFLHSKLMDVTVNQICTETMHIVVQ